MISSEDALIAATGGQVTFDAYAVPLQRLKDLTTVAAGMGGRVRICGAERLSDAARIELSALGLGNVTFVDGR